MVPVHKFWLCVPFCRGRFGEFLSFLISVFFQHGGYLTGKWWDKGHNRPLEPSQLYSTALDSTTILFIHTYIYTVYIYIHAIHIHTVGKGTLINTFQHCRETSTHTLRSPPSSIPQDADLKSESDERRKENRLYGSFTHTHAHTLIKRQVSPVWAKK